MLSFTFITLFLPLNHGYIFCLWHIVSTRFTLYNYERMQLCSYFTSVYHMASELLLKLLIVTSLFILLREKQPAVSLLP